jgi:hypothetical protein
MTDEDVPAGGRWFRVNTTWSQSEWIAVLPPAARLAWIEVLSHVKAHGYDGRVRAVAPVVFARMVGIDLADVRQLLDAAQADGALEVQDGDWVITGWKAHQGDPTGKERLRRFRARQKRSDTDVTRFDRYATDTETETSTETETKETTDGAAPPAEPAPPQPKVKRATALPEDVAALVDDSHREIIADAAGVRLSVELAQFADHHRAKGTTMKDWRAGLRTWLRNAVKFAARDNRPPPGSQAAERRQEIPRSDGPRTGHAAPAFGPDPAELDRRREREEDERIEHWKRNHPAEAEALAEEVQAELARDPRWHGTPQGIVAAAATSKYRLRILERLGPRAA